MARNPGTGYAKQDRKSQVAVGYLRRSTDRQEQSIPDQKAAIEAYAEEHGFRVHRYYTDDAVSGTSTVGRRAFQALMADAKRKRCEFQFVIVYDVKRFGRVGNDEAGYYRHLLHMQGIEVLYVSENFTGDSTDDLIRPVKQWQARQESKDLSKVTIRGLLSKVNSGVGDDARGAWMGGVPPYGYDLRYQSTSGLFLMHVRFMRDGAKEIYDENVKLTRSLPRGETIVTSRSDYCKLVLSDKSRVATLREIFRLYVEERRGYKAVADALNRKGVLSPRGPGWDRRYRGKWSITTIRSILTNPVYVGDTVWNRRTDARFHRISNGQAIERPQAQSHRLEFNDESDWIVVPDTHPVIVSRRKWEAAKFLREELETSVLQRGINSRTGKKVGSREPPGGWTGPRSKYLLSKLMTCGRCGNRYEGHSQYLSRRDKNGKRHKTLGYACGGYIRHGRSTCQIGRLKKELLEEAVIEAVIDLYKPFIGDDAQDRMADVLDEQIGSDITEIAKTQASIKSQVRKIDRKVRNLLDNITARNKNLADVRLSELTQEREQLEDQLESLENLAITEEECQELITETAGFIASLRISLSDNPLDRRQAAIRRCVDGIVIDLDRNELRLSLRKLPMIFGGSLTTLTETITIPVPFAS
ncbi:MAG: recombinase family protein [Planctomycetes bacterium]|nr:recombinase family protein [Planctomycetota bacterium]